MKNITEGDIHTDLIESLRETIKAQKQTIETLQAQVSDLKMRNNAVFIGGGTTWIPNTSPSVPYTPWYPSITCGTALSGAVGTASAVRTINATATLT